MIFSFGSVLAWIGALVLIVRLWRRTFRSSESPHLASFPFVSIVVPARNEEKNLPPLLMSLSRIDYPSYEVIVVDDNSKDRTREIAKSFSVRVVESAPLPEGWVGKNWACHQAISAARGSILLFTDADTRHEPDGLSRALHHFVEGGADLMSAYPYHDNPTFWERLMGPFHALLCVATNYQVPQPRRLFAVGQYLMFTRSFYDLCGGHAAVKSQYPDDLALANLCYEKAGNYRVFVGKPLFRVRMYATFWEFVQGWRRNFLAGIQQSSVMAFVDVVLVFFALHSFGSGLVCLATIAYQQRRWGRFSLWGPIFFPFALTVYCGVTLLAAFDFLTGNRLAWKGRSYVAWRS